MISFRPSRPLFTCAMAAALLCGVSAAQATLTPAVPTNLVLSDSFDSGLAGWVSAGNGLGNALFQSSGGNPGGYAAISDSSLGWAYFSAPAAYRHAALADGALSFNLIGISDANHPINGDVRVALTGKDDQGHKLTLVGELVGVHPTADWTSYSFAFGAGLNDVFRVQEATVGYSEFNPKPSAEQWAQVMGSLTDFLIGADYSGAFGGANGTEEARLDNVRYQATFLPQDDAPPDGGGGPTNTVPEPGMAGLLLAGLVALLAVPWLRRSRAAAPAGTLA